jgi:hypothetical protein
MMAAGLRATAKAVEHPPEPKIGAPVLDPTKRDRADIDLAAGRSGPIAPSRESSAAKISQFS